MMRGLLALFAAMTFGTSLVADERRLSGDEARSVHTGAVATQILSTEDRQAGHQPWRQEFHADGRTTYHDEAGASHGRWDVRGNRYCSTWGTGGVWDCYDVYLRDDGARRIITWQGVDGVGNPTSGRFRAWIVKP